METVELTCEKRALQTKGEVREIRRSGGIPGVLYGPRTATFAVAVPGAELAARVASAARQRLLRLKSSSPELDRKHVILKEIQRAPISGAILHADFYEVDLSQRIRVEVALRFTGRAAGVIGGGILQPLERQIEVECFPLEIPEFIEVDVTALGIHDTVHVSGVKLPDNVKPMFDTDYPVATVLPPTVEEAPAAALAEGVAAEGAAAEEAAPGAAAPAAEGGPKEGAPAAARSGAPAGAARASAPTAARGGKKSEPAKP